MLFIETTGFIDVDNYRQHYFLVFEKYNKDRAMLFVTEGYMIVSNYYVYPDKTQPHVSQILILTRFQGQANSAPLLKRVYRYSIASPSVLGITVEDPSKSYLKLRDFVTCSFVKICLICPGKN